MELLFLTFNWASEHRSLFDGHTSSSQRGTSCRSRGIDSRSGARCCKASGADNERTVNNLSDNSSDDSEVSFNTLSKTITQLSQKNVRLNCGVGLNWKFARLPMCWVRSVTPVAVWTALDHFPKKKREAVVFHLSTAVSCSAGLKQANRRPGECLAGSVRCLVGLTTCCQLEDKSTFLQLLSREYVTRYFSSGNVAKQNKSPEPVLTYYSVVKTFFLLDSITSVSCSVNEIAEFGYKLVKQGQTWGVGIIKRKANLIYNLNVIRLFSCCFF